MRINQFPGLIQAASPYAIPPGAAVEQVNIMSLVPGQLTVRGGSVHLGTFPRCIELWGWSPGSGRSESMLGQTETGDIVEFSGLGGTLTMDVRSTGVFTGDHPVSFSQGRRGEIFIYQGYGKRGLVRTADGTIRPVGMDAPTTAPRITIDSSPSYYVARIDIVEPGGGYYQPPSVTIVPPNAFTGRAATAIARLTGRSVSSIEVTDGGAGYTAPPLVKIGKPVAQSTGGVKAIAALEPGAPDGDHKSGVVYWNVYQPSNGGFICYTDISGNRLQKWRDGFLLRAHGGSGSGAMMYLELTDLGKQLALYGNTSGTTVPNPAGLPGFPSTCPAPLDSDFGSLGPSDFWKSWQVYDFGSGYQPGDEVYAYIFTTSFVSTTVFSCGTLPANQMCPVVFKGYVWGSADCPDDLTVKEEIVYRRARISPTMNTPGSGYLLPPRFVADDGEIINSEIDDAGAVTALLPAVPSKTYIWAPELQDEGPTVPAQAQAIVRANFRGKYQCYYRFVNDNVPASAGGPLFSSLSPVTELDCGDFAAHLDWAVITVPGWATSVELWRTTSNQATTVFRVAKIKATSSVDDTKWFTAAFGGWRDTLSDRDLADPKRTGFLAMPILLSDGSLNANRFGVASPDFAVGVVFQDRSFLSVDTTGKRPNAIQYSEADEPESCPDVNELVLQTNVRDTDYVTALIPYAGALLVAQSKHVYRLTFVSDPGTDAQTALIAYRGCLNQRTWDIYLGNCFVLDEQGLYTVDDRGQVENLSSQLDTMFRINTDSTLPRIDFSKREWFFVRADRGMGVIRVHIALVGDAGKYPTRQLVYDPDSKTWWSELYPTGFSAAGAVRDDQQKTGLIHAGHDGLYSLGVGLTDSGAPVAYSWKTGNMEFVTDEQRGGGSSNPRNVSVVFKPTHGTAILNLSQYYNGSPQPRANASDRDRGVGFTHLEGETNACVDMDSDRLEGAESHGIARALFSGRTLHDIYGTDTHVALRLHGEQTDHGPVVIHSVDLQGVVGAQSQ